MMMVLGMTAAFAGKTTQHTITVTNTDQAVAHTYKAYQIFKGNLDAAGQKLSDIEWGDNVDGDKLLAALKADETYGTHFTDCDSAAKVAEALGKTPFKSTTGDVAGGAIDAIAKIISETKDVLKGTATAFTASGTNYTATVTGDGYYLIKDETTGSLTDQTSGKSDTLSKYLLAVVNNVTVEAKDTGLNPDKNILLANGADPTSFTRVKENTAAVGDIVTFEVTIPVPNTKKYVDHFILDMNDTLPAGMTYFDHLTVKVGEDNVPHTATVKAGSDAFTAPETAAAAVKTTGGQTIKVVFNNFKAFAEEEGKNRIGQNIVITYQAVVNENAEFGKTGNENEVYFDYSNDPNHDYNGDEPGPGDVVGQTVHKKTITYVTTLEIVKVDGADQTKKLSGAEFEITSDDYNMEVETGERFEKAPYTAKAADGETVGADTWYLLKDGTYTKTAKTPQTANLYEETTDTYVKVSYTKVVKTPGESKKVTAITNDEGLIVLKGLKPGTYKVKETKAPAGYNLDSTEYTLVIGWKNPTDADATEAQKNAGGFYEAQDAANKFTMDANGAKFSITLVNNSGSTLPSTGGMGTTLLYIGGSILVLVAAILLITKRRMSSED